MKTTRGPLAVAASHKLPLWIKPQPTVFDGVYYEIGYYKDGFVAIASYSRQRDARRALRNIDYVQEGNRWVSRETVQERTETSHAPEATHI